MKLSLLLVVSAVACVSSFAISPVRPTTVLTTPAHARAAVPTSLAPPAGFYSFATTLLAEVGDKPGDRERQQQAACVYLLIPLINEHVCLPPRRALWRPANQRSYDGPRPDPRDWRPRRRFPHRYHRAIHREGPVETIIATGCSICARAAR